MLGGQKARYILGKSAVYCRTNKKTKELKPSFYYLQFFYLYKQQQVVLLILQAMFYEYRITE